MYLPDATRRSAWQDLGLLLCGLAVGHLPLILLGTVIYLFTAQLDERLLNVLLLPVQAAMCIAVVAAILRLRRQSAASIGWTTGHLLWEIPLGLLAMLAAFAAFYLCIGVMWVAWPAGLQQLQGNAEAITKMLPPIHPAAMVGLQVLVGLYEELVFRGFLLTRLRRALGSWWLAVVVGSALFAAPHLIYQEPAATFPLFGVGVAFCLFTIWRKSLVPAIIGHALFNSLMLLGVYLTGPQWT